MMKDTLGRSLRDLRISVTDRCNFRCRYCMPKEVFGPDHAFLPHDDLLTFEEISRLARLFVDLGVQKIRLTGGEPLLRRDIDTLITMLSDVGAQEIALTTNGSLLTKSVAKRLYQSGLNRVTISLDSLDDDVFMRMNDVHFPVSKVLAAIDAAQQAGLNPVKVNMVVRRGWNEQSIVPMAERFRNSGVVLRLIEYMDVGNSNGWKMDDVVTADDMAAAIHQAWPISRLEPNYPGEVAQRYTYKDGAGEIGIIASVTRAFCGGCTRGRLSAEGKLYTCLFGAAGHDFRSLVRSDATDEEIQHAITSVWGKRADRYSEQRTEQTRSHHKVEMSHIGG